MPQSLKSLTEVETQVCGHNSLGSLPFHGTRHSRRSKETEWRSQNIPRAQDVVRQKELKCSVLETILACDDDVDDELPSYTSHEKDVLLEYSQEDPIYTASKDTPAMEASGSDDVFFDNGRARQIVDLIIHQCRKPK